MVVVEKVDGHFGCKIELLPFRNLAKNTWDYQNITQSTCFYYFLVKFASISKIEEKKVKEKKYPIFFLNNKNTWSTSN